MELEKAITELGLPDNAELRDILRTEWESSQVCLPTGRLPFLSPEFTSDAWQTMCLPEDAAEVAIAVGKRVSSDPALSALAWHFHHCVFRCTTYPSRHIQGWPSVAAFAGALQEEAGMFYLLVLISGLPTMQDIYTNRSIPPNLARDTLSTVKDEMDAYRDENGVWGIDGPGQVEWFRYHLRAELFHLGRLQFQIGLFDYGLRAFRHRTSGTVVALSEDGVSYLPDGQLTGPGWVRDTADQWTSKLTIKDDEVTGYPIMPQGCALHRKVHLPTADWQEVLAPNDPALHVHIPDGDPLAPGLCKRSFELAMEFFPRHFPERPFVCFCCESWVLDSQLQELLPPTSNLVRFQKEMYLLPCHTEGLFTVIFHGVPEDPRKAPQDTTLQRALLDRLVAGEHLHASAGACFLLAEDFNWGGQVYLRQEFPW
jgi:hypothetical protein